MNPDSHAAVIAGLHEVTIKPPRRVRGKSFDWDHGIQVALPAKYHKTHKRYPVLWVTDGPMYFELAVKTVHYDLRFHLPEMIIVAVGPPASELKELSSRRSYEFLSRTGWNFSGFGSELFDRELETQEKPAEGGGADMFLSFLVDELRALLSREYRMNGDHTLFGDSGGGYFALHALFSRADAFSRYICGSPNLSAGDLEIFRREEQYARDHADLRANLFIAAGEGEILDKNAIVPAWGVVSSTVRMAEILFLRKYPSLKLHVRVFPGEDHASVVPLNLSWGLRAVWG